MCVLGTKSFLISSVIVTGGRSLSLTPIRKLEHQSPPHPQRKSFSLYKETVAFFLWTFPKAAASVL